MLDFQPNAVHAGIYAALADGSYDDARRRPHRPRALRIHRRPEAARGRAGATSRSSTSTTSALARERGLDLVGVGAIVQRPLAAVIAARPRRRAAPRPTSRAARSASPACPPTTRCSTRCSRPAASTPTPCDRVTIGFDAVAALAAGQLDAATAFWNAEGVALRRLGVPTREFRVDDFGAPRVPRARPGHVGRDPARPSPSSSTPCRGHGRRLRRRRRRPGGRRSTTCSTRCPTSTPASSAPARRADRRRAFRRAGDLDPPTLDALGALGPRARDPSSKPLDVDRAFPALDDAEAGSRAQAGRGRGRWVPRGAPRPWVGRRTSQSRDDSGPFAGADPRGASPAACSGSATVLGRGPGARNAALVALGAAGVLADGRRAARDPAPALDACAASPHRRAHRAGQPPQLPRGARGAARRAREQRHAARRRDPRPRQLQARSTTPTATRTAMRCCARSALRCAPRSAPATSPRGSAARSSP